jgi:hypothetical protein
MITLSRLPEEILQALCQVPASEPPRVIIIGAEITPHVAPMSGARPNGSGHKSNPIGIGAANSPTRADGRGKGDAADYPRDLARGPGARSIPYP